MKLEGKYCKDIEIFTDNIEEDAIKQIYEIAGYPEFKGSKIRIMPDVHSGKGIVIGFTAPLGKYVNPSHIGCDINCSVSSVFFDKRLNEEDYPLFESRVKRAIPMGVSIHKERQFDVKEFLKYLRKELQKAYQSTKGLTYILDFNNTNDLEAWVEKFGMDLATFYKSIGTLGGGNHFLEYDLGDTTQAFTIHTGSRNLGLKVWKYWDKVANSTKISKDGERAIIKEVKERVTDKTKLSEEIKAAIDKYKLQLHPGFLEGENMRAYLTDIVVCSAYAKFNHKVIQEKVSEIHNKMTGSKIINIIETRHNYIDFNTVDGIPMMRKGAVRANLGEEFILPFNMRDGIAICEGLGNPDWNYSMCHGCGRIMSRSKAKEIIKIEEYQETMKGIYSTSIGKSTIDEAPQAYKSKDEILEYIKPNCKVKFFMHPVINLKCAEEEKPVWKK